MPKKKGKAPLKKGCFFYVIRNDDLSGTFLLRSPHKLEIGEKINLEPMRGRYFGCALPVTIVEETPGNKCGKTLLARREGEEVFACNMFMVESVLWELLKG